MKRILLIVLAICLSACATSQRVVWNKPGASEADYNKDITQCDYETSAATQSIDYSYNTIFGQELDRAMRKNELIKKCMAAKGWTAMAPTSLEGKAPPSTKGKIGILLDNTLGIREVQKTSPAELAGIRAGDKILEIDGIAPSDQRDAVLNISGEPGTSVQLKVYRDGSIHNIKVIRGE